MADSGYIQAAATAADAGGGLITSAFNVHEIRQNRRFQRNMANTAHQREVADLRAAGLNPMLSINKGADVPTGQPATVDNSAAQVGSKYMANSQTAAQMRLTQATINDTNSAAALKDAQKDDVLMTRKNRLDQQILDIYRTKGEMGLQNWQMGKYEAEINNLERQKLLIDAQLSGQKLINTHSAYDLERSKSESKFYKGAGGTIAPWLRQLQHVNPLIR